MCLGIPGEIVELRDEGGTRFGKVRFAGVTRDVCLACLPDVAIGEFVVVHVGFAIARIDAHEAARLWKVLEEMGAATEVSGDGDGVGAAR